MSQGPASHAASNTTSPAVSDTERKRSSARGTGRARGRGTSTTPARRSGSTGDDRRSSSRPGVPPTRSATPRPMPPPKVPNQATNSMRPRRREEACWRGPEVIPAQRTHHQPAPSSPDRPLVRSEYGAFRPPIKRVQEETSLTGLTRRSQSRLGSILFTLVFLVIFLVIVIQTLVSLLSASAGP
jgi:hypothetical protein